jgi:hypothetical protein
MKAEMAFAQAKQQKKIDRWCNLVPAYRIGDQVLLNAQNIITCHSSGELNYKCLGPFPILTLVRKYAFYL